jgi:hypothetical protein
MQIEINFFYIWCIYGMVYTIGEYGMGMQLYQHISYEL